MRLFSYWRSSASWRVRIGLRLKGLDAEIVPVNLRQGEQWAEPHLSRSGLGQVPVLEVQHKGEHRRLTQSLAILQWLDALQPSPPLIPPGPWAAARAWQMAEVINAGTQPLQNLTTQREVARLSNTDGQGWCREFITRGLDVLETMASQEHHRFLASTEPTIADCCLVPQIYNARRFACDTERWPRLMAVEAEAMALPAFRLSHPDHQPDAH